MLNVVESIIKTAKFNAAAPAILSVTGSISYAEISQGIAVISNYFADRRLPLAAKVILNIHNPDLRLMSTIAAMQCGLVPIVVSNIEHFAQALDVDFIIGAPEPLNAKLMSDLIIDDSVLSGKLADKEPRVFKARADDDLLYIGTTTGTTGNRKLVPETYSRQVQRAADADRYVSAERIMSTIGGASHYGLSNALRIFLAGACIVRSYPDPLANLTMINVFGVDTLLTTPATADLLMDFMEAHSVQCPSIKQISLTGSLFPAKLIERLERYFNAKIQIIYGTSETGGISRGFTSSDTYVPGYVGEINPRINLVFDSSRQQEPSELLVLNDNQNYSSYYVDGKIQSNTEPFFRLPDLGYVKDGKLFIVGRDDEVYNFSGNKIHYSQFESELRTNPDILDVGIAALSTEGDPFGLIIGVVTAKNLDPEDLRNNLCAALRINKARNHIRLVVIDAIPRNEMGKIDRIALQKII